MAWSSLLLLLRAPCNLTWELVVCVMCVMCVPAITLSTSHFELLFSFVYLPGTWFVWGCCDSDCNKIWSTRKWRLWRRRVDCRTCSPCAWRSRTTTTTAAAVASLMVLFWNCSSAVFIEIEIAVWARFWIHVLFFIFTVPWRHGHVFHFIDSLELGIKIRIGVVVVRNKYSLSIFIFLGQSGSVYGRFGRQQDKSWGHRKGRPRDTQRLIRVGCPCGLIYIFDLDLL